MSDSEQGLSQTATGDGWFRTTHWSVVIEAGGCDSPERSVALAKLRQGYWFPILGPCETRTKPLQTVPGQTTSLVCEKLWKRSTTPNKKMI